MEIRKHMYMPYAKAAGKAKTFASRQEIKKYIKYQIGSKTREKNDPLVAFPFHFFLFLLYSLALFHLLSDTSHVFCHC